MIDISERLKTVRKARGLTIQAVASGIGIAVRTYQNYEYGVREISVEALYKLADFYGVSTDYLLGREETPDAIEMLVKEFGLSKMEELFIRVYFMSEPDVRKNLITFAEKIVAEKEKLAKEQTSTTPASAPPPEEKTFTFRRVARKDGEPTDITLTQKELDDIMNQPDEVDY